MPSDSAPAPTRASLKAWWNQFNFAQRVRKDAQAKKPHLPTSTAEDHPVFGKPLRESLKYASVQISTADANGNLYVWGYIPVVVAKCGLYLKENATEIEGTFRVNGSNKRMRELQAIFEAPPRYGKSLDWKDQTFTPHDVASVFRRYLTQMPEPVIPIDMYHDFRNALANHPNNEEEVVAAFKRLIHAMPRANQYLLLYVLDLLSVFARRADKNRMDAANLAVIFRPGLLSHPADELRPAEHRLSQRVLEMLIAHQDWFITDVPPPSRRDSVVLSATRQGIEGTMPMPSDGDPTRPMSVLTGAGSAGWSLIDLGPTSASVGATPAGTGTPAESGISGTGVIGGEEGARVVRRRTVAEQGTHRTQFELPTSELGVLEEAGSPASTQEGGETYLGGGTVTVTRSRTVPSSSGVARSRSQRSQRTSGGRSREEVIPAGTTGNDTGNAHQPPGSPGGRRVLRKQHRPSQERIESQR